MKVKERSEKVGLKLNIKKRKIMASGPLKSWQTTGKQWKQCQTLFSWAPKSLQVVTAAMKLKDACSMEKSYDQSSSVQFSHSVVSNSLQLHGLQHASLLCPSPTPGALQTHVHHGGDALQPSHPFCHPLLLLPLIFPSIRVFSNESVLHIMWPKYWSFSFNIR